LIAALSCLKIFTLKWEPDEMPQIVEARHVAGFPQDVLGTYAMADQPDIVGYLVNQQLVQTKP